MCFLAFNGNVSRMTGRGRYGRTDVHTCYDVSYTTPVHTGETVRLLRSVKAACCIKYVMHTVDVHSSSEVCSSAAVHGINILRIYGISRANTIGLQCVSYRSKINPCQKIRLR